MKGKMLVQIADYLCNAEKLIDNIAEDMSEQITEEEELYIELLVLISNARNKILNQIKYPKIEELTVDQIVEVIEYGMRDITDVVEMNQMKRLINQVENGRLENYRCVIEWEIKNWYLNKIR